ncbi:hypothetical protein [Allostreptomyces psammosilenae]|uniref:Uncharacterized protein n=1 Tax=Allostreptomyces psammosilenae TaxID=1892865 RepID=A0A853ABN3_9ACTN|nr:hypothetical protein [Allostreptomyces psammosilenae]NYI07888.1 hypothetical protein [Allostreptomyces psammosilenae]
MRRHDIEPFALLSGVFFVLFGVAYLLGLASGVDMEWRFWLPVGVVWLALAGCVGAVTGMVRAARRRPGRGGKRGTA